MGYFTTTESPAFTTNQLQQMTSNQLSALFFR
jgi:hypothetical protein